jgi:GNAT superfamily N-acetyltransferase
MIYIYRTNIYKIHDYSVHLKNLTQEDKYSRFGHHASDQAIDEMILNMCYHPHDHELWYARTDDTRVGWGHMAKNRDNTWELAVSVNRDHQLRGIGGRLIAEMLAFSKFNKITEVWMNCIEGNRIIQHLATKNELTTKHRGDGERTGVIRVPEPTILETNGQLWKEQVEVFKDMGKLQAKLGELWVKPILPK